MRDRTDEELMMLYSRQDSNEAFLELYRRYSPRVYGFLKAKGLKEADRETLFQETFLKLHVARGRYTPEFPLAPWIFTICRNALIDHWRRHSKGANSSELDPENMAAPDRESLAMDPAAWRAAVAGLSADQRGAIEDRYLYELPFEAIAARLHRSESSVRQIVSRGIRRLRRRLWREKSNG